MILVSLVVSEGWKQKTALTEKGLALSEPDSGPVRCEITTREQLSRLCSSQQFLPLRAGLFLWNLAEEGKGGDLCKSAPNS